MQPQQQAQHTPPPNGGQSNGGDASSVVLNSPGGGSSTPKGTQRPPPPPGFGAAHQSSALGRQPVGSNGTVAPPQSSPSVGTGGMGSIAPPSGVPKPAPGPTSTDTVASSGPMANGVLGNQHTAASSSNNSINLGNNQPQQLGSAPAAGQVVIGASPGGGGVLPTALASPGTTSTTSTSGAGVASSTQLNPAAPPFRSLHGGSLEHVEGNLLAQADAGGWASVLLLLRTSLLF